MARSTLRDPANRRDPTATSQRAGLGYRDHPEWRDMSKYAVHFTKTGGDLSASDVLRKIVNESQLIPGPDAFGAARNLCALGDSQRSVCFSGIPLDMLDRLVKQRGSAYGLAFRNDFLGRAGGAPVWYLQRGTPIERIFFEMSTAGSPIEVDAPIWKLTPFVDYPGDYRGCTYQFEWEREWRVPGCVSFSPRDISFLFVPEAEHAELRYAFPSLECPLVDAGWGEDRLQRAFSTAV